MLDTARLAVGLENRYAIEREIGAGGMATVFLARDRKHDRMVALKVLRPELAAVLGAERFLQEIRITAGLDHPHILTLIESGETDGFLWFVLPYVRGESLRQRLTREKQLRIEDALRIATQVAMALDYAHRHGVIHRDIKPENILLHEGEAVVTDFGIALALREAGGERLTESGLSLGTPQYMSPEQATGEEPNARSDVYSLGAVVYEMLTGEPPHTGPTIQAIVAKLLAERPTRIRTVRPTVSRELEATVERALDKVASDRFLGAMEFATALASAASPPIERRRRWLLPVSMVGALALASLVAALWHPWRPAAATATRGPDAASVAVMMFENLTGSTGDQYLSDGMTDEVIRQLARVRSLKVISRTSSEALRGTHLTLRQIADTLGVRHVLEGSVRHAASRIRVTVDLIDAATDAHIWSSTYDRDLTDMFAVQEEIARTVADSLGKMIGVSPTVGRVARTEQPEAYEAYLMGNSLVYRRTLEGLRGARDQFEHTIARDSAYAPAYAGLASAYMLWVIYSYAGMDLYEAWGRDLAMADRAIALDSGVAEAYALRGITMTHAWAPAESIATDLNRALALQPNSANAHQWNGQFLSREGHYDEGLAQSAQAVALDPLAPGVRLGYSAVGLAAHRYDVAVHEAERAATLQPGLMLAHWQQALGYLLSGDAARCAAVQLGPYGGLRAVCLYALGQRAEAARVVDSLRTAFSSGTAGDSTFSPVLAARGVASYFAWTGDASESLAWLERAYAISPMGGDLREIRSGMYDKVRDDPGFRAGIERVHAAVFQRVQRERRRFALR